MLGGGWVPIRLYRNLMNTIFWAKGPSSSHDDKHVRIMQTKSSFHSRSILIMAFFFFFSIFQNLHACPHLTQNTQESTETAGRAQVIQMSAWPSNCHLYLGWKDKHKFCILKAAPSYPPCPATSVVSLMLGTSSIVLLNHSNNEHSRKKMPNVSAAGLKPASLTSRDFLPWSFGSVPSGRVYYPHVTHLPCLFQAGKSILSVLDSSLSSILWSK